MKLGILGLGDIRLGYFGRTFFLLKWMMTMMTLHGQQKDSKVKFNVSLKTCFISGSDKSRKNKKKAEILWLKSRLFKNLKKLCVKKYPNV